MGVELSVELVEGSFPHATIRTLEQGGEAALGEFHFLSPVIGDFAECHVDIGQLGKRLVMAAE